MLRRTMDEGPRRAAPRAATAQVAKWFLPTMHGDVLLTSKGLDRTELRAFELTPTEAEGMRVLRKHAFAMGEGRRPWVADPDAFLPVDHPSLRTEEGFTVVLDAPIAEVQAVLAQAMKPGRTLISAVRFSDGTMEEVHEVVPEAATLELTEPEDAVQAKALGEVGEAKAEPRADGSPPGALVPAGAGEVSATVATGKRGRRKAGAAGAGPSVAVTVAAPHVGCPTPEWPEADIRANRVLEAFLTEEQLEDYRRCGAFMARGADTGRHYVITNRERPGMMHHFSFRSIFDVEADRPLCVHDWEVPPPEEMLALNLCVTLPGRERHIRRLALEHA